MTLTLIKLVLEELDWREARSRAAVSQRVIPVDPLAVDVIPETVKFDSCGTRFLIVLLSKALGAKGI